MTLYNLIFTDDELDERFNIGFFSTREKAEDTARYYLRSVRGFCEYCCSYSITEKNVAGTRKRAAFLSFTAGTNTTSISLKATVSPRSRWRGVCSRK